MSSSEVHAGKVSSNEKVLRTKAKHEEIKARKEVERAARQAAPAAPVAKAAAKVPVPPSAAARGARLLATLNKPIVRQGGKPAVPTPVVPISAASRSARLFAALKKPIVKQNGRKRVIPK